MKGNRSKSNERTSARDKLLAAALAVVRRQGYSATTVDELCAEAGVTKGAFFHHFESKDALAVAAAEHWSAITGELFANAPYRKLADPLDRVLGYIDFRRELVRGETAEFTCLVGTMVQEIFHRSPEIRAACERSIFGHAAEVAKDIAEAKKRYAPKADWNPESLAVHTQAVLQGAFILTKAKEDAAVVVESIAHLRRYVESLFNRPPPPERK